MKKVSTRNSDGAGFAAMPPDVRKVCDLPAQSPAGSWAAPTQWGRSPENQTRGCGKAKPYRTSGGAAASVIFNFLTGTKFLLVILLLIATAVRTVAQEQDNDDVQLWPDVTVGFRLTPAVTLNVFGTMRFGQDISARITHQVGAAVNFRVNDYLSIVPAYRSVWSYPTPTRRSHENRYFVDVTPRLPLPKGFTLLDRNRSEVRDINEQISWRYRNRVQLEKALTWHEHEITPYLASEFHYESRYHTWNRKMIWAGTRVPVHKHVTLDIHYAHTWDAQARPGYWHIVGIMTRMEF